MSLRLRATPPTYKDATQKIGKPRDGLPTYPYRWYDFLNVNSYNTDRNIDLTTIGTHCGS